MKSKYLKAAVAILVVLVATAVLFAQATGQGTGQMRGQGRGHGPGMHGYGAGMMGPGMLGHMAQALQLTDAQKADIKSMWQERKPALAPLIQQLANGHQQMIALTANGSFDEAKVRALANQQSQAIAQLLVEKERLQSQIYTRVLTPEQRTKFDQMQQQHAAHINEWLQRMATAPAH